jgi:FkbM family methyltransferase
LANAAKRIAAKGRSKILGSLQTSLDQLQERLARIETRQADVLEHASKSRTTIMQTGEHEILVKLYNGLKIYLDNRDIGVVPHMALDGIWEPEITHAWNSLVRKNDTVFDIGANFGYFGLLAAQMTDKKNSKIVFVEANPHLIPYIEKTLALNWYKEQSAVENVAVSDKPGAVTLNILEDYIASSSVHTVDQLEKYLGTKMNLKLDEGVKVPAIAIDDYCKKNSIKSISLIKMDIEGYEDVAYAGMRKTIQVSPDVTMFIEFTKEGYKKPKEFYRQMLSDFGSVYLINSSGRLYKPKNNSYETVIGNAEDWAMPVFSKRNNLDSL